MSALSSHTAALFPLFQFKPKNFSKVEAAPLPDSKLVGHRDGAGGRGRRGGRGAGGRGGRGRQSYQSEVVFGGVVGAGGFYGDGSTGVIRKGTKVKSEPGGASVTTRQALKDGDSERKVYKIGTDDDHSGSSSTTSSSEDEEEEVGNAYLPTMLVRKYEPVVGPIPEELMVRPPENDAALNSELWRLTTPGLDEDAGLMLFQLPSVLPIPALHNSNVTGHNGGAGPSNAYGSGVHGAVGGPDGRPASLAELPSGKIGKMYVLRNGSVKIQIGEVLFDVAPGVPGRMLQQFAAVDATTRECTVLGDIQQRIVVTPDIDALLSEKPLPEWKHADPDTLAALAAQVDEARPAEERQGTAAGTNGHDTEVEGAKDGKNKSKIGLEKGGKSEAAADNPENNKFVLVGHEAVKMEVEGGEVGAVKEGGKQEKKRR